MTAGLLAHGLPPTATQVFAPGKVAPGGLSSLTFSIHNPNGAEITEVAFTDTLPPGVLVEYPVTVPGTCGGGLLSTSGAAVSLSGGTIDPGGSCGFKVDVIGVTDGMMINTTGAIASSGGDGAPATATLTVAASPVIAMTFGHVAVPLDGSTTMTFTVINPIPWSA